MYQTSITPRPLRYPVELTRPEHNRASHAGDACVIATVILGLAVSAAYHVGYERAHDELIAARAPIKCPVSDTGRDVIEHTWSHRGEVFYRECLLVDRPPTVGPAVHTQRASAL